MDSWDQKYGQWPAQGGTTNPFRQKKVAAAQAAPKPSEPTPAGNTQGSTIKPPVPVNPIATDHSRLQGPAAVRPEPRLADSVILSPDHDLMRRDLQRSELVQPNHAGSGVGNQHRQLPAALPSGPTFGSMLISPEPPKNPDDELGKVILEVVKYERKGLQYWEKAIPSENSIWWAE